MRLAVLGATGRSGVPLVEQALERGHTVQALVRSRDKAGALGSSDRLVVVEGDLLDEAAVGKVIDGVDAVVNVAGHTKGSPTDLQQRMIASVLEAMRDRGVDRLLTLTGAGVRTDGDRPKVVDKVFGFALKAIQPKLLADSEAYVAAVRAGDLRWTIVRAPRLTDDPATGAYRVARNVGPDTGFKLPRRDLATFLLDELDKNEHVGAMPVVSV